MAGKYGVKREGWPENGGTEAPMKVAGKFGFGFSFLLCLYSSQWSNPGQDLSRPLIFLYFIFLFLLTSGKSFKFIYLC